MTRLAIYLVAAFAIGFTAVLALQWWSLRITGNPDTLDEPGGGFG